MDALYYAGRGTAIVFALALIGSSFLLWGRSKGAALLGAVAGAGMFLFEIVFIALAAILRSASMPPAQVSYMFAATGVLHAIAGYVPLCMMVILLARRPR